MTSSQNLNPNDTAVNAHHHHHHYRQQDVNERFLVVVSDKDTRFRCDDSADRSAMDDAATARDVLFDALRGWFEFGRRDVNDPFLAMMEPLFRRVRPTTSELVDECSHAVCCQIQFEDDRWYFEKAGFEIIAERFGDFIRD